MPRPRKEVDPREIARLRKEGLGAGRIAKQLGVSKPTVLRVEKRTVAGASAPGGTGCESLSGQPGAGNRTGSVPRVGTPDAAQAPPFPSSSQSYRSAVRRAARTPDEVTRQTWARLRLGSSKPYDSTPEQVRLAEEALESALDEAPTVPYERIVDEIAKVLRKQVERDRERDRQVHAQEEAREHWTRASQREFELRWDKEVEHEEWKLRNAEYGAKSALRDALRHAKGRAEERFARAIKPRPTGDNVDKLIDKIIDEQFADALGTDDEPDAEVES